MARAGPPRLKLGLAFASANVIWGSIYLGIRIAVETLPPFLLAGARFVIAGAALYLVRRTAGTPPTYGISWMHAAVAGTSMIGIGNGLVTFAEVHLASNLTALLIASVPLMIALMEWARPGGARPAVATPVGIALGAAGIGLLVSPSTVQSDFSQFVGIVSVLIVAAGWGGGTLYSRYRPASPDRALSAAQQMLTGGASMLSVSEPGSGTQRGPTDAHRGGLDAQCSGAARRAEKL